MSIRSSIVIMDQLHILILNMSCQMQALVEAHGGYTY
jgi:hypothetical protein